MNDEGSFVNNEGISERIRLVEGDLALTSEFIRGVVAVSATLRTSAITLWVALLGFAFSQRVPELALLAVAMVIVFAVVDAYHGWLYAAALRHARSIEKLLAEYYNAISRHGDEPEVETKFRGSLRAHRYGPYGSLSSKFRPRYLCGARPWPIYVFLYPALAIVALGVCISFWAGFVDTVAESKPLPSNHCLHHGEPSGGSSPSEHFGNRSWPELSDYLTIAP